MNLSVVLISLIFFVSISASVEVAMEIASAMQNSMAEHMIATGISNTAMTVQDPAWERMTIGASSGFFVTVPELRTLRRLHKYSCASVSRLNRVHQSPRIPPIRLARSANSMYYCQKVWCYDHECVLSWSRNFYTIHNDIIAGPRKQVTSYDPGTSRKLENAISSESRKLSPSFKELVRVGAIKKLETVGTTERYWINLGHEEMRDHRFVELLESSANVHPVDPSHRIGFLLTHGSVVTKPMLEYQISWFEQPEPTRKFFYPAGNGQPSDAQTHKLVEMTNERISLFDHANRLSPAGRHTMATGLKAMLEVKARLVPNLMQNSRVRALKQFAPHAKFGNKAFSLYTHLLHYIADKMTDPRTLLKRITTSNHLTVEAGNHKSSIDSLLLDFLNEYDYKEPLTQYLDYRTAELVEGRQEMSVDVQSPSGQNTGEEVVENFSREIQGDLESSGSATNRAQQSLRKRAHTSIQEELTSQGSERKAPRLDISEKENYREGSELTPTLEQTQDAEHMQEEVGLHNEVDMETLYATQILQNILQCQDPGTSSTRKRQIVECSPEEKEGSWTLNEEESEVTAEGTKFAFESDVTGRIVHILRKIPEKYSAAKRFMESHVARLSRVAERYQKVSAAGAKVNRFLSRFSIATRILNMAYMAQQKEYGMVVGVGAMTTYTIAVEVAPLRRLIAAGTAKAATAIAKGVVAVRRVAGATEAAMQIAELGGQITKVAIKMVPYLGIAFGGVAVGFDIARLVNDDHKDLARTVALSVNLAIDIAITGLSVAAMFFPPLEAVVAALTILRMVFEGIFLGISNALKDCGANESKLGCAVIGLLTGISDILLGGFGSMSNALAKKEKAFRKKIESLNDVKSYMKIDGDCNGKHPVLINFMTGDKSSYGGKITFELYDSQDYKITIEDTPIFGGGTSEISKTMQCKMLRDAILGLGETVAFTYENETAKIWGVISVGPNYRMIKNEEPVETSLTGVYHGNDKDNTFHAVRGAIIHNAGSGNCEKLNLTNTETAKAIKYKYYIYGNDGNDRFILGPQHTFVEAEIHLSLKVSSGGDGYDVYMMSSTGGDTIIDNFAVDGKQDTLLLDTSRSNIQCFRENSDLLIRYCSTHKVRVLKYFMHGDTSKHAHLTIATKDNFEFGVFHDSMGEDAPKYDCWLTSVDSASLGVTTVDLNSEVPPELKFVTKIIGSNDINRLVGNKFNNIFIGKGRKNTMAGKGGNDQYILKNNTQVVIDNCDESDHPSEDRVMFPVSFVDLKFKKEGNDLVFSARTVNLEVRLKQWFERKSCQHATLVSSDHMIFGVKEIDGKLLKAPYILDYSSGTNAIKIDMKNHVIPNLNEDTTLSEVKSIISSQYDDRFVGNKDDNLFVAKGKGVYMEGGGGEDTYHIESEAVATVNFTSTDEHRDTVRINCKRHQFLTCFNVLNISWKKKYRSLVMYFTCLKESDIQAVIRDQNPDAPDPFDIERNLRISSIACATNGNYITRDQVSSIDQGPVSDTESLATVESADGYSFSIHLIKTKAINYEPYFRLDTIEITSKNHELCCEINMKLAKDQNGLRYLSEASRIKVAVNDTDSVLIGNDMPNGFFGGRKLLRFKSYLEGGLGADHYVISAGDGRVEINNDASDKLEDYLNLDIPFEHVNIAVEGISGTVLLFDERKPTRTQVKLLNYWKSQRFRHLRIRSTDHVEYVLQRHYPHKVAKLVNLATSKYPEYIQLNDRDSAIYSSVTEIYGSHIASNVIFGTRSTEHIVGGLHNDSMDGGPSGEVIEGFDGNDYIYGRDGDDALKGGKGKDSIFGGEGNDILCGGPGSDVIDGGPGFDYVVFGGGFRLEEDTKEVIPTGVTVNLGQKTSSSGDSNSDYLNEIEGVLGTAFDDNIQDDYSNNVINSGPGDDRITSHGGNDRLIGDTGIDTYDLRKASGTITIDNFDNSTNIKQDFLLLPENAYRELESTENEDLGTIQRVVKCSFLTDSGLQLVFWNDLTVILEDWNQGPEHKHLSIQAEAHEPENMDLDSFAHEEYTNESLKPKLSLLHESDSTMHFAVLCPNEEFENCQSGLSLYFSSTFDPKLKKIEFGETNTAVATNLMHGDIYSFVPVLARCNVSIVWGETYTTARKPSPPINISAFVIDYSMLHIEWKIQFLSNPNHMDYKYHLLINGNYSECSCDEDSFDSKMTVTRLSTSVRLPILKNLKADDESVALNLTIAISTEYNTKRSQVTVESVQQNRSWSCEEALQQKKVFSSGVLYHCKKREAKTNCSMKRTNADSSTFLVANSESSLTVFPETNAAISRRGSNSQVCLEACKSPLTGNKFLSPMIGVINETMHLNSIFEGGKSIMISCLPGSLFHNYRNRVLQITCHRGKWFPRPFMCIETCPAPPSPANGKLTVAVNQADYSCDYGKFLLGEDRLTCIRNIWGPVEESMCLEWVTKKAISKAALGPQLVLRKKPGMSRPVGPPWPLPRPGPAQPGPPRPLDPEFPFPGPVPDIP